MDKEMRIRGEMPKVKEKRGRQNEGKRDSGEKWIRKRRLVEEEVGRRGVWWKRSVRVKSLRGKVVGVADRCLEGLDMMEGCGGEGSGVARVSQTFPLSHDRRCGGGDLLATLQYAY